MVSEFNGANPLMTILLSVESSLSDFLSALRKERNAKSQAWTSYRECISRL